MSVLHAQHLPVEYTYAEPNLENYFKKYRIIEEVVDILHYFTDPHPQIQKSKLGVLVKMASILDKNLQYSHLTISGIQKLLQEFKSTSVITKASNGGPTTRSSR